MCYIHGHGTITQTNEMADGVERGGGVRDEAFAGESRVPVVDDFPSPTVSLEEEVAGVAGETTHGGVVVPTTETNREPVADGSKELSSDGTGVCENTISIFQRVLQLFVYGATSSPEAGR